MPLQTVDLRSNEAKLEALIDALEAKLEAMERAGMALIAGCEASDWSPWYEALHEWRALVAISQQKREDE